MKPLSPSPAPHPRIGGSFVSAFGGRYYRITHCDRMPPFFMNVVSSSDLWLFLASNGGLTAGRVDAEHALFPYQTVDRIYDSAGLTGPFTVVRAGPEGREILWEPFTPHPTRLHAISRLLYKSVEGDRVWFEENHHQLGLTFRYGWSTAGAHGLVRRCELHNPGRDPVTVRVLDGLRNLLPPGIPYPLQAESSCLVDAYKTAELLPGSSLAVYALAAGIVDRAIPMESLRASIAWSEGLPGADVLLSDDQLSAFYAEATPATETHRRGVRCTYAVSSTFSLAPGATRRWLMVTDTGLTQADVTARRRALAAGGLAEAVLAAADASTQTLRTLVGTADGLQTGGEETTTAHHFANVLFNIMRGGIFAGGHQMPVRDFAAFVHARNRPVAARHADFLAAQPRTLPRAEFLARLAAPGDRDLERLGLEYLPLSFSRRHGDPSRPWNRFRIQVRDEQQERVLHYEGNWRDIFQNWEALCLSFPDFLESIIAKFVNASTVDGYNPYRVSHTGIEWESPDPENPWASIGYWGDHQVVYLLRLLEWSARFHPGLLAAWLRRELFSYANVPYRIRDYAATRRNPHSTIEFDAAQHEAIERLVAQFGTDARFVLGPDHGVLHVNLTEKLLVLILTRLTNFVPGGGIWMNTQRPEWNDANNALVGYGVSLVTLCHLRRLLVACLETLLPALGRDPVPVSRAVGALLSRVAFALDAYHHLPARPEITDEDRRALLDLLASAGSDYRAGVYRDGPGAPAAVEPAAIVHLLQRALVFIDHTIRLNLRSDGLYHAYNLLEFTEHPAALKLHHLGPMLEGQVAVMSAGLLSPDEAVGLMTALRHSPLYRADQHSYLLYPDRRTPGFLERNIIPAPLVARCPLLKDLLDTHDLRLVLRDVDGRYRFHPDLVNAAALEERLHLLAADRRWAERVHLHGPRVVAIYEQVFNHRAFTGRSGSMFGYEGLGCIYWHMVAKLLVAVQENLQAALDAASPQAARLAEIYQDVRAGLGFNKTPAAYGAFPTDPYSHTPGHSGAQQPGMTGQVKEEVLTRFGELGVRISQGTVRFAPAFLRPAEFTAGPGVFPYVDAQGRPAEIALPAQALGFTLCGVPVVYHRGNGGQHLRLRVTGQGERECPGLQLDAATSALIFARTGEVERIDVTLAAGPRRPPANHRAKRGRRARAASA
ncbi:MAG TPA: hypothetical protein VMF63_10715 [Opitutaceae bacterium]|nr:hypothetical protein [Opitutaceae bacterium]